MLFCRTFGGGQASVEVLGLGLELPGQGRRVAGLRAGGRVHEMGHLLRVLRRPRHGLQPHLGLRARVGNPLARGEASGDGEISN